MNNKSKLLTGALALAVTASTVLAATNASADPGKRDRDDYRYNRIEQNRHSRDRDDRYRNQSNNGRYQQYPQRYERSLPSGFRRVVYRNRVYYVRDNHYYAYDSNSRGYINVRLPFINIHL